VLLAVRRPPGGTTVGFKDAAAIRDRLSGMIRTNLDSQPVYTIEIASHAAKDILVLTVAAGEHPPYGINPANPQYYIRRAGITFPARPHEVQAIVERRMSRQAAPGPIGCTRKARGTKGDCAAR
jgi:predicted HTH transcriptional regulator